MTRPASFSPAMFVLLARPLFPPFCTIVFFILLIFGRRFDFSSLPFSAIASPPLCCLFILPTHCVGPGTELRLLDISARFLAVGDECGATRR